MEPTLAILYQLQHLAILANRQSDQVLQEQLGIGMSQYRILQVLAANPSIQQKQIASLLGQTEASISRQVKLMQSKSMIVARVNPKNRREHRTTLLPLGERLLDAGTQVLLKYYQPLMQGMGHKEQAQLLRSLGSLHGYVCDADTVDSVLHFNSN